MYRPISESTEFRDVRLVATDMDGTLTKEGKFTSLLLQALENLATNGIQVLIVTGRSAGWVSGISSLMPVVGALAENGGIFYPSNNLAPISLTPIPDIAKHRQNLARTFEKLQSQFPQLRESSDNQFRLTDWTFDVAALTENELQSLNNICQQMGWGFTYSNVQCHIKPQQQDKAVGLLQVLRQYFPGYSPSQVVTVGDSPNDESLFNQNSFPLSVGVANVIKYAHQLQYQPVYVTTAAEGEGFCELSNWILQKKADSRGQD
ncbi:HAD family phosphatase [Anabaena cylindrica FACHB-243]|uniref:HAD-superfamily hydrolase, subfamily IIB n=1 Tax=Anabaena cylindrica (strain ATCC 27899 / PCC 7122) TaxID=272123 RepID=K9ZM23_ANACC|nr:MULTISPECIES: HAD family hydrolase [Anabaena]AFZ59834.1 HAD-superfamily hydrolase, subfamily IIB [Anabaena cylindrica PCC 7122]MBD2417233.1 HAD family phosphatase [Anabaena cylindrica FACHB-243]MBY5282317.1 HAD family phosphatase [Anabaena sp. CCAP 1446/1C]MBY5309757.1 HAD family phosphatase [Anabaena sp. CCAP 1446/1C]MCM2404951.1 Cof-type HAD-IIB family hydrolase [Anabaena sp. CCAP 1446/1C]